MKEGTAISSKNEKERLYYGKMLGAFIEADRALSEYKALVDISRYHGGISIREAAERAKDLLKDYQVPGYPEATFFAYGFMPEKIFNGISGPDGTTSITSSWYKLMYDVSKGKYSHEDSLHIQSSFVQMICHEAAHHEFRFFEREHIFPSKENRLKCYINECYADMRAAEMMCYKASRAAEIYRYRVKNIMKEDPDSDKDFSKHPSYKLRYGVLKSGYFDKGTVHMLAQHLDVELDTEKRIIDEMDDFKKRHSEINLVIEL